MDDKNKTQTNMQADTELPTDKTEIETGEIKKGKRKLSKGKKAALIIILILVVLAIVRIAQGQSNGAETETAPVNVKTGTVELTSIHTTSPVTGRVTPVEEVSIMPLASGEITSVNVSVGDEVNAGTVLFEIDKTQMATTVNQAREAYNAAKSAYDRMSVLYNEGAVSLQDYENVKTQYVTAKESYTSASDAYGNCTVKSPISGFVTSLSVQVGGIASSAAPAATVADVSELEIETTVSEYLISEIKTGDPVEIYISTLGSDPFIGTIKAFSPAPAQGSLTYPVTISVNDDSGKVMAGMFAEVQIISEEKDAVLCIPSDAVIMKYGESVVVALDENNLPIYKKVNTGIDNGEYTEITSGLAEGETIIISGQQYVTEGQPVNITDEKDFGGTDNSEE